VEVAGTLPWMLQFSLLVEVISGRPTIVELSISLAIWGCAAKDVLRKQSLFIFALESDQ
jgi:hypothetical protein